jgi:hypothetical protein
VATPVLPGRLWSHRFCTADDEGEGHDDEVAGMESRRSKITPTAILDRAARRRDLVV